MTRTNGRWERVVAVLVGLAVLGLVIVLASRSGGSGGKTAGTSPGSSQPTVSSAKDGRATVLHTDHATFGSANDLAGQSAVVIVGTVQGSAPGTSTPIGNDPSSGQAVPPLPHTDFSVKVDRVIKAAMSRQEVRPSARRFSSPAVAGAPET